MTLIVNGKACDHHGEATIPALLREIGASPEQVAVMVNGEVIPRAKRDTVALKECDKVEVIAFAGGG